MSTTTESQIHAAASHNRELLSILTETDYAVPALEQQNRYITDLQNELRQLDASIGKLEASRLKELKDHEKYRDSTMKRFAYKVARKTDKFEAKASKEEQEYFQALSDEHQAKESKRYVESMLGDAQKAKNELDSTVARHRQAQRDLDALYDSIFAGPTPSFPEEDEKERAAEQVLQNYHDSRMKAEAETQVTQILGKAIQHIQQARLNMDNALQHSRMDMFGGGAFSDMMERSALAKAQTHARETQMLVEQASRISPFVENIPPLSIAQGNLMSDVLFDNIFTDMAFHKKIQASVVDVDNCAAAVSRESNKARLRLEELNHKLGGQARSLDDSRVALQKAREAAFERTVGTGVAA